MENAINHSHRRRNGKLDYSNGNQTPLNKFSMASEARRCCTLAWSRQPRSWHVPGGRRGAEVSRKKSEMEEISYLSLFTSFPTLSHKITPSAVFCSLTSSDRFT